MKKTKINQEEEVVIKYTIFCPICDKKIKGNSSSHVEYNLKIHIDQKHKTSDRRENGK